MTIRSRARNVQRALSIPYQRAHQLVEGLGDTSEVLAKAKGWPLGDADVHLLKPGVGSQLVPGSQKAATADEPVTIASLFQPEALEAMRGFVLRAAEVTKVAQDTFGAFVTRHQDTFEAIALGVHRFNFAIGEWAKEHEPELRGLAAVAQRFAETRDFVSIASHVVERPNHAAHALEALAMQFGDTMPKIDIGLGDTMPKIDIGLGNTMPKIDIGIGATEKGIDLGDSFANIGGGALEQTKTVFDLVAEINAPFKHMEELSRPFKAFDDAQRSFEKLANLGRPPKGVEDAYGSIGRLAKQHTALGKLVEQHTSLGKLTEQHTSLGKLAGLGLGKSAYENLGLAQNAYAKLPAMGIAAKAAKAVEDTRRTVEKLSEMGLPISRAMQAAMAPVKRMEAMQPQLQRPLQAARDDG